MTTIDSVILELPDGMLLVDDDAVRLAGVDPQAAGGPVREQRRWMSDDGLFVVASVSPAVEGPELDPLALDLAVGGTVERYKRDFDGVVDAISKLDIAGALAGRVARLHLDAATGERLELLLLAALTADRDIVVVQVTFPAALAPRYAERAQALGRSLAVPAAV